MAAGIKVRAVRRLRFALPWLVTSHPTLPEKRTQVSNLGLLAPHLLLQSNPSSLLTDQFAHVFTDAAHLNLSRLLIHEAQQRDAQNQLDTLIGCVLIT
jgi:hypothetical protein